MLQRKTSVAAGLKAAWAVCSALAVASLLGGCGQKGPLFLPAPAAQTAPAASPASSPASAP
ncbi:MAG: lipoprotein [Burkholderiales bacterium]|nr:lipoprotein [Burkholderiales bacterium]